MQQDALNALDNQLKALELRKAGVSYQRIAETLGYKDASGAWRAVKSALKKTLQEPADELRTLEIERLDAMLAAIWGSVKQGQYGAQDRALKIMERRAKLLGLDAPVKQDLTSGGMPVQVQDMDEVRKKRWEAIAARLEKIAGKEQAPDGNTSTGQDTDTQ